ncbi:hypothetical protein MJO28_001658 [Puccinia striiformis f. sp. tritici]|uniref:Uncharacterized protein n=1 Tax=Puccinia striiformis f. sp. tritici TaxID=168172 RepID=A0ACC0ETV5_9BASI|nr:hypothetical protein MJO28_001658 [Puccinia striiformis f. sp. tritici]
MLTERKRMTELWAHTEEELFIANTSELGVFDHLVFSGKTSAEGSAVTHALRIFQKERISLNSTRTTTKDQSTT